MAQCRFCGAEIIWAKTEKGRDIPLDAVPVDPTKVDGTCILEYGVARFGPIDAATTVSRYVSHFATCPNAKKHRKS